MYVFLLEDSKIGYLCDEVIFLLLLLIRLLLLLEIIYRNTSRRQYKQTETRQ